jgi:hypothetical protein
LIILQQHTQNIFSRQTIHVDFQKEQDDGGVKTCGKQHAMWMFFTRQSKGWRGRRTGKSGRKTAAFTGELS